MIICHSISNDSQYADNTNFNTQKEVFESEGPISFDGVYKNIWKHRSAYLGRGGIIFIVGDWIGKDNSVDVEKHGQPLLEMAGREEIGGLVTLGFELGWHTWSHPDLTQCSEKEILQELACDGGYKKHFAYPYGKHDERVRRLVELVGFENAWVLGNGDNSQFQRRRWHI